MYSNGRKLGHVVDSIPHTDLALVELNSTTEFENQTFHLDYVGRASRPHVYAREAVSRLVSL